MKMKKACGIDTDKCMEIFRKRGQEKINGVDEINMGRRDQVIPRTYQVIGKRI